MSDTRSHLSIGEVLSLLQDDFPDITISKIRFLESQGLLNPERTPSGYRKFHDEDTERLRWILTQQRDHFLPLKVIKERLAAGDFSDGPPEGVLPFERSSGSPSETHTNGVTAAAGANGGETSKDRARAVASLVEGPNEASVITPRGGKRHPTGHTKGEPIPVPTGEVEPDAPSLALTAEELCAQSGLSASGVADLERFGLLKVRSMGHVDYYDEEALVIARLAAGFARFGIEPRHLRMYKVSADREAGLFEQLITPLLKQRRSAARDEAVEMLEELAELADDLRAVMVRASLRDYLGQA